MGNNPSGFQGGEEAPQRPVDMVSWFDSVEYCNRRSIQEELQPVYKYNNSPNPDDWYDQWPTWNENFGNHTNISCDWEADGYRLPTEAEWQHAANAGIHPAPYIYAGNDDVNEVAWFSNNSDEITHDVGELLPNGLGIYDMSGNVFEWCWDIYGATFPSGGDNPRGSDVGGYRVTRGGSWSYNENYCAVSYRYVRPPTNRSSLTGFRLTRRLVD